MDDTTPPALSRELPDRTLILGEAHLLDALGAVLAAHETVSVHGVTWHVDWDNPPGKASAQPPSRR